MLSNRNTNVFAFNVTNIVIKSDQQIKFSIKMLSNAFDSLSNANIVISNLYSEQITNYSVSQTSNEMGASTSITLTFNCSNYAISSLSYIMFYLPKEYSASQYVYNISKSSLINGNAFQLTSIVNPIEPSSSPFIFNFYNSGNEIIAISSNTISFSLVCNLPCKNCVSVTQQSLCTSCYSSINWIK
jgi:hypothetical protein